VTEGVHKFVINVPEKAEQSSVLLSVSNAAQERVVYDANPVYTLNISSSGSQSFDLSYLMYDAADWKPAYDLHLLSDSVLVRANAVLSNRGGEDLKNVRLKLVAGLPQDVQPYLAKAAPQINQRYAEAAPKASLRRSTSSSLWGEKTWSWTRRSAFPSSRKSRPW
jgi:hypothetical protein